MTAISLVWVASLLIEVWPELSAHSAQIRVVPLLLGLASSLLAAYLTFEAFAALVRMMGIARLPRRELGHLYFTAQLLKHLPGRVWGIGYQSTAGRSAGSVSDWLLANLGHMILATYIALWSALLVLLAFEHVGWALTATVVGVVVYIAGWWLLSSRHSWHWLRYMPRGIAVRFTALHDALSKTPASTQLWIALLLSASSLLSYAGWFAFGVAYTPLGGNAGVQLCALYMLAWFVGYISLVTPSGIGVRELVFVWMARDFPADAVALMALIGRANLLCVDVALGLLFAPFAPRRR